MKQNYKNMAYVAFGLILISGCCALGYKVKEDFEQKKKELSELKGYENLETINEESDNKFKPKKESKLEIQCNSNAEDGEKSCHLY
jgi:hypothetical protein